MADSTKNDDKKNEDDEALGAIGDIAAQFASSGDSVGGLVAGAVVGGALIGGYYATKVTIEQVKKQSPRVKSGAAAAKKQVENAISSADDLRKQAGSVLDSADQVKKRAESIQKQIVSRRKKNDEPEDFPRL